MGDRRCRGLTLVETIFCSVFISITVLAVAQLFPGAFLSVRTSNATLQADMLARSIIEELRHRPISTLPTNGELVLAEPPFEPLVIDGMLYTPEVSLYSVANTDQSYLRHVKVTVKYRLQESLQEKKYVHETYLHGALR